MQSNPHLLNRNLCLIACIGAALLLPMFTGCSEAVNRPVRSGMRGATSIDLPNTPPDVAFDAGVAAMRQYFTRVKPSPAEGKIESSKAEYSQKGGTGRMRDAAGHRNRLRRQAEIWIRPTETGSVAFCLVSVERLDTSDYRVFQQHQEFDDVPNATPIDRAAAVSAEQNETWTPLPHDARMENELLRVLFNRANPQQTPSN